IAQAWAAGITRSPICPVVGRIEVEHGPRSSGISGSVHGNVSAGGPVVSGNEKNCGEPRICRTVVVAAGITGELCQPFGEQHVDIKRSSDDRTIATIDREGRIHRFDNETVAHAQSLVGRLKFATEVGYGAIQAADSVKISHQFAGGIGAERSGYCFRHLAHGRKSGVRRMNGASAFWSRLSSTGWCLAYGLLKRVNRGGGSQHAGSNMGRGILCDC